MAVMNRNRWMNVLCATLLTSFSAHGDGPSLLSDATFRTLHGAAAAWTARGLDVAGDTPAMIQHRNGAVRIVSAGRQPKPAGLEQPVNLEAGIYEMTVKGQGRGRLRLRVGDYEREMPLADVEGVFGLLVDWPGGLAACRLEVVGQAEVTTAELRPATDAQREAWQRQQHDLAQFGYITVSAQRPLPGRGATTFVDAEDLDAMTERAVFADDRLDFAHVRHMDRLIDWLADNGFARLRSEGLREWMQTRIENGAYGSVLVMSMGLAPQSVNRKPGREALWYRYLAQGGRIVWIGNPPFYVFQSVRGEPATHAVPALGTLGLSWGWSQPFWGSHRPVTLTDAGRAWGLEGHGSSITGYNAHEVSIVFAEFTTEDSGQRGAASWMLNLRPDLPWSGLLAYVQSMDARRDMHLRDVWRLAHYVGEPVAPPSLPRPWAPPPPPAVEIQTRASGLEGRTEFARGETVHITCVPARAGAFDEVRMHLIRDGEVLQSLSAASGAEGRAVAALDSAPYAFGDYVLRAETRRDGRSVAFHDVEIGIRHVRPVEFGWEVWTGIPGNEHQARLLLDDVSRCGMDVYIGRDVRSMDWLLRYGRRFSERVHADPGKGVTPESHPHRFIVGPRGELRRWGQGRAMFGISHPESLAEGRLQMIEGISTAAAHPAFNGVVLSNDDYSSLHYGVDYGEHNLSRFRDLTGHDAPPERPRLDPGIVPDDDPWVQWCLFTLEHVTGGWNQMQKEAVQSVREDIRIGPIPGGMQIPMIHMWPAGQYPPLNFGDWGHNLAACYYYNSYWQPPVANTCWLECGRMANRGLPTWLMPSLMRPLTGYTRNNLFHLLAGGVRGLTYFTYDSRTREAWEEMRRVSPVIRRIAPVQARIRPAGRRIALLHSVTSDMFREGNWLLLPYAYANLIQNHYDVDIICEEEVRDGVCANYDAVLLYRVLHLRRSVYDALAEQAGQGALILADASVPLDIPGVRRLSVDLGMGTSASLDLPPAGAHAATPGPQDYGHPERIRAVGNALREHVAPPFECGDERLVAHPFEYGGVRYIWFVNALSGEEYRLLQDRVQRLRTAEALQDVIAWERQQLRLQPVFEAAARFDELPGVPYDLLRSRRLDAPDGRTLNLSMDRFGGVLIAFYPEAIETVSIDCPPVVGAIETATVKVTVSGRSGPMRGTVPVEIVLTDPRGERSPLTGVRGTEEGVCSLTWIPAVNDPAGAWTVSAVEQASGREASAEIVLSKNPR